MKEMIMRYSYVQTLTESATQLFSRFSVAVLKGRCSATLKLWAALAVGLLAVGNADAQDMHPYFHVSHQLQQHSGSFTWTIPQLCKAYNFPTGLKNSSGVIGILEFGGGWVQSDLDKFSASIGMPKIKATNVSVNGGQNLPGQGDADIEVTLDIQFAAASYYYATGKMPQIYVFFAPNSTAEFTSVIQSAVSHKCDVLSISWGAPEAFWSTTDAKNLDAAVAQAANSGLAVFAAAGDNSSSDGDGSGQHVDCPGSCPHIVSCGGTSKTSNTEVVWGDGKATDWGTGGGFSAIFATQSYQVGAPKPPKGLGRMVPDIAGDADPNTGMVMYIAEFGGPIQIGGTSCVAPIYAGLFAALHKKPGFVNPTLWKHPTAFVDITQGSNGAYKATKGADPCTGLGVVNGKSMASVFGSHAVVDQNMVSVNFDSDSHTLTLTGDANPNSLTISRSGSQLQLKTSGGTLLSLSINSETVSDMTTSATIPNVSGSVIVQGDLSDGNDSVTLVGLQVSTLVLDLGDGNDAVNLTYCTVQTSEVDGGSGTNVLTLTGSKVTNKHNTNVQASN